MNRDNADEVLERILRSNFGSSIAKANAELKRIEQEKKRELDHMNKCKSLGVPEYIFKDTPLSFSCKSGIIELSKLDVKRNVLLDSIDELKTALMMHYNGCSGAQAGELGSFSGDGGALLCLGYEMINRAHGDGFINGLISDVVAGVESRYGCFDRDFDRDGLGNFFKTHVEVKKFRGKYVLSLWAAYVDDLPEKRLAGNFKKPLALYNSCIDAKLSVVDDYWFNVDFKELFAGLPISDSEWSSIIKGYDRTHLVSRPRVTFKHEGREYVLNVGIDANGESTYLRPFNKNDLDDYYLKVKGDSLVGGSWTHFEGSDYIDNDNRDAFKVKNAVARVSVSFSDCSPAVTKEEEVSLKSARDYIMGLIKF